MSKQVQHSYLVEGDDDFTICPFCQEVIETNIYNKHKVNCSKKNLFYHMKGKKEEKIQQYSQLSSDEDTKECHFCMKPIKQQAFTLHEAKCKILQDKNRKKSREGRRNKDKVKKQFQKKQVKPLQKKISSYFVHDEEEETQQKIACSFCGYMQTLEELDTHPFACQYHEQKCIYCDQPFPESLMNFHVDECPEKYSTRSIKYNESQSQSSEQDYHGIIHMMLQQYISSYHHPSNTGLTPNQIKRLDKVRYQAKGNAEKDICSICYCQFEIEEKLVKLKCKHLYHEQCISKWLQKNIKCPVCKSPQKQQSYFEDDQ